MKPPPSEVEAREGSSELPLARGDGHAFTHELLSPDSSCQAVQMEMRVHSPSAMTRGVGIVVTVTVTGSSTSMAVWVTDSATASGRCGWSSPALFKSDSTTVLVVVLLRHRGHAAPARPPAHVFPLFPRSVSAESGPSVLLGFLFLPVF